MDLKTPLYDAHVKAKGKIVPFAGYLLPVQYEGGIIKEHMAVRTKAADLRPTRYTHPGIPQFMPLPGRADLRPTRYKIKGKYNSYNIWERYFVRAEMLLRISSIC